MPTFAEIVSLAGKNIATPTLQPVIEKELLHHEILRAMAENGLLHQLTFIGDTCLRACYGSNRLSEDLNFTGETDFKTADLRDLSAVVRKELRQTYDLDVHTSDPKRVSESPISTVSTWKLHIITHPGSPHLPQQRIHLDICAVNSYEREPHVLTNHYGIELGTSGLIIQAESRHEILADKILALALRPNRMKHRDLWDIAWLVQNNQQLETALVWQKCHERRIPEKTFIHELTSKLEKLKHDSHLQSNFMNEMKRFLPQRIAATSIDAPDFWAYLVHTVDGCAAPLIGSSPSDNTRFSM